MSQSPVPDDEVTPLTVRCFRSADADRVWHVHKRTIQSSPLPFVSKPSFDEDLRNVPEHYFETGGTFLVGCLDDTVIATGGMRPEDENAIELRRLRVMPDHQQQGYGTALLEELEAFARREAFDRITLHTDDVLTVAQSLYEAHGYEETHREPHPVLDGEVIFYEKPL
ncbi:GNAT family N-acetyltransferase [Halorhabdus sp. CBA1104]|uniref:GNAT family N-acetyltransferase n=1 Tax=unclassified Halorhabdus TaxID=2621901 RepID=UPI0012B2EBD6|nr:MULTISPECIES: GNAT family N-acetyltransferase [unclassified Halorhabdus]QGN05955.1 GNAT family N-acetyltransferase [Halorhabdus sp. CBA1104]